MQMQKITAETRQKVNEFIMEHWFSTEMVVRGEVVDMTALDGFILIEEDKIIGLVTYRFGRSECEIMSLDSLIEHKGYGTALVDAVIGEARGQGCSRIKLITTNDNINALRFYQKRGFDMAHLYHNALENSRRLKPSIPLIGENDIPIKHEIEFVMELN